MPSASRLCRCPRRSWGSPIPCSLQAANPPSLWPKGADMSHQRQIAWREKHTPQEWRGYRRLGAAVMASAVRDLETLMRAGRNFRTSGSGRTRILDDLEPQLKFWCQVANFDVNAILRTDGNGGEVA